jgi:hypothetical protein
MLALGRHNSSSVAHAGGALQRVKAEALLCEGARTIGWMKSHLVLLSPRLSDSIERPHHIFRLTSCAASHAISRSAAGLIFLPRCLMHGIHVRLF